MPDYLISRSPGFLPAGIGLTMPKTPLQEVRVLAYLSCKQHLQLRQIPWALYSMAVTPYPLRSGLSYLYRHGKIPNPNAFNQANQEILSYFDFLIAWCYNERTQPVFRPRADRAIF